MLLFAALHRLSWLAFLGLFLWAGVVGLPRHGALILSCLLWYVLGYWLLRGVVGIAHACRRAAPSRRGHFSWHGSGRSASRSA